mgnify:FL=1
MRNEEASLYNKPKVEKLDRLNKSIHEFEKHRVDRNQKLLMNLS